MMLLIYCSKFLFAVKADKPSSLYFEINTCSINLLEDHWSCSSPERLSHCKLMRFKLIENRPMKVYAWTLLTPGAWPNLTQGQFTMGTTKHCYIQNIEALGLLVSEKKIFLVFPIVSLWRISTPGAWPNLTPGAWLAQFM